MCLYTRQTALPFIWPLSSQMNALEVEWLCLHEISINVSKLLAVLLLPVYLFISFFILHFVIACLLFNLLFYTDVVVACLLFYPLFMLMLLLLFYFFISFFLILSLLLYFCLFADHVNNSTIILFTRNVSSHKTD